MGQFLGLGFILPLGFGIKERLNLISRGITWVHVMGILETGVVSEGKNIIKNQQVSNGTTNPAPSGSVVPGTWVS